MRVLFYTHDLFQGRERLMPWRTVLEVAIYFSNVNKWETVVFSGESKCNFEKRLYKNVNIISVPKPSGNLAKIISEYHPEVIIWPVSWRTRNSTFECLKSYKGQLIAYLPGGVYKFKNVMKAFPEIGIKAALPFFIEATVSKKKIVNLLTKYNFSSIVTFTKLTKYTIQKAGLQKEKINWILPGMDNPHSLNPDWEFFKTKTNTIPDKFLLFMGSPAAIRGSTVLLKAFERLYETDDSLFLICLIRKDPGSKMDSFDSFYNKMRNRNRVMVIKDILKPSQLLTFIMKARAVILPFLLVPSEIPLTYFEVLSQGIPVITFENMGSSNYIENGAIVVRNNSKSLAKAMKSFWEDDDLWKRKHQGALELMKKHPSWEMVGTLWSSLIGS